MFVVSVTAMKLADYLDERGLSYSQFARRIGVSQQAVNGYIQGERYPKPLIMKAIYEETGGRVGPMDFAPLDEIATA